MNDRRHGPDQDGKRARLHLVSSGRGTIRREGQPDVELRPGDVVLVLAARAEHGAAPLATNRSTVERRMLEVVSALHVRSTERWSIVKMAKIAGMSRAAFSRHFKKTTGFAPLAYLTHLRMERARHLLTQSDDSVSEIAESAGYESVYAFSRAFKRLVGVAPRLFRQRSRAPFTTVVRATTTLRMAA